MGTNPEDVIKIDLPTNGPPTPEGISSRLQTAVARRDAVMTPWLHWEAKKRFAAELIASGFCPSGVTRPAQVLAIIQTGQELGIPPMRALRQIAVIQGKPTMSAELMLAKMLQGGVQLRWIRSDDKAATLRATRPNLTDFEGTFTIEEAQRAGLLGKPGSGWTKYQAAMLRARVISLVGRVAAPDIIGGLYTPEELGADVTEDGEVVASTVVEGPTVPDGLEGSPFEAASWEDAIKRAPTPGAVTELWLALTQTFRGTWLGFSPEAQKRVAGALADAKARSDRPVTATVDEE